VVMLIRGAKGTVLKLTVRKPDGNLQVIPITRDVVQLEAAFAKAAVLQLNHLAGRFAYIDLPKFYGQTSRRRSTAAKRRTASDLLLALQKLNSTGVRGLILDLRGNTGGLLNEAIQATGLFIPSGPVLQMRNIDDKQWTRADQDKRIFYQGPMVIMVDRFSASASEILASALQDYGRAVIVGSVTSGKGTVQKFFSLGKAASAQPDRQAGEVSLGTLKLTILQYYQVKGESIQLHGVLPDIPLPDPAAHRQTYERLRTHPITEHAIAAVPYKPWPHLWKLPELRAHSIARQATHAAFDSVKARTAFLVQQLANTVVSLNQTTWLQQRQQAENTLSTLQLDETPRFAARPLEYISVSTMPAQTRADKAAAWAKKIQSDIWIEEALRILSDMAP
ncbi:MAG: carboxy terminal-processing peptidase, partial [bacterium]|nr:carboxy terminal-processing peptidase [bacterium]